MLCTALPVNSHIDMGGDSGKPGSHPPLAAKQTCHHFKSSKGHPWGIAGIPSDSDVEADGEAMGEAERDGDSDPELDGTADSETAKANEGIMKQGGAMMTGKHPSRP